jgi:hypothetical protein
VSGVDSPPSEAGVFGDAASVALAPETFCVTDEWGWATEARWRCERFLTGESDEFAAAYLRDTAECGELDLRAENPARGPSLTPPPQAVIQSASSTPTAEAPEARLTEFAWCSKEKEPLRRLWGKSGTASVFGLLIAGARFFWFDARWAKIPTHETLFAPLGMVESHCWIVRGDGRLVVRNGKCELGREGIPLAPQLGGKSVLLVGNKGDGRAMIKRVFQRVQNAVEPVSEAPIVTEDRDQEGIIVEGDGTAVEIVWIDQAQIKAKTVPRAPQRGPLRAKPVRPR